MIIDGVVLLDVYTYQAFCECGTDIRYRTLTPAKIGDELPIRCWCNRRVILSFWLKVLKLERAARQSHGMPVMCRYVQGERR